MRQRPAHLVKRQVEGETFSESAILIRSLPGSRQEDGRWSPGRVAAPMQIKCVSSPSSGRDRDLMGQDAARIGDARRFYIETDVELGAGRSGRSPDVIVWQNERYRVKNVAVYAEGIKTVLALREDPQM